MADRDDAERLAVEALERVNIDASAITPWTKIVRLMLGADAIVRIPRLVGQPAALHVIHGRPRIALSAKIPYEYQGFYALHEVGHWLVAEHRMRPDDEEAFADAVAAALLAPKPAFQRVVRAVGFDYSAISDEVVQTETWAALRTAEIYGIPTVVVAKRLRIRGDETWVWGESEAEIRALSRQDRPGIHKTKLTDDPKRIVLTASK